MLQTNLQRVANQSATYFNNHSYFLTAFSHISRVLEQSGTTGNNRGSMSTSPALMQMRIK